MVSTDGLITFLAVMTNQIFLRTKDSIMSLFYYLAWWSSQCIIQGKSFVKLWTGGRVSVSYKENLLLSCGLQNFRVIITSLNSICCFSSYVRMETDRVRMECDSDSTFTTF